MNKIEDIKYQYDLKGKNGIDSRPFISTVKAEDKGHGSTSIEEKGIDSRPLIPTFIPDNGSQTTSNPVYIPPPPPPPVEKK